jgi:phage host-nuclease inhibitor protein Gam
MGCETRSSSKQCDDSVQYLEAEISSLISQSYVTNSTWEKERGDLQQEYDDKVRYLEAEISSLKNQSYAANATWEKERGDIQQQYHDRVHYLEAEISSLRSKVETCTEAIHKPSGVLEFTNGATYEGELKDDLPNGKGNGRTAFGMAKECLSMLTEKHTKVIIRVGSEW